MSVHPLSEISGTAFVVNYSRAKRVDISNDIYADLWVTDDSIALWNAVAEQVYPHGDLNISLRNRFYLTHLLEYGEKFPHGTCLNLGGGFTNYPFLVDPGVHFFEFDFPSVTIYKEQAVSRFIAEGKLPQRDVQYIPVDLNDPKKIGPIKQVLIREAGNMPSIVILEGITYYLDISMLNMIFSLLCDVQPEGSLIVFDYWKPDTMEHPVMIRLKSFMDQHFGYQTKQYTLFDETFIHQVPGYKEIESIDIGGLEMKITNSSVFQDLKIPAYFSVLQRTDE